MNTNIWHTLAKNALNEQYNNPNAHGEYKGFVGQDIPCIGDDKEFNHFIHSITYNEFYMCLTPEEQCLFLLFCGESYEQ